MRRFRCPLAANRAPPIDGLLLRCRSRVRSGDSDGLDVREAKVLDHPRCSSAGLGVRRRIADAQTGTLSGAVGPLIGGRIAASGT